MSIKVEGHTGGVREVSSCRDASTTVNLALVKEVNEAKGNIIKCTFIYESFD